MQRGSTGRIQASMSTHGSPTVPSAPDEDTSAATVVQNETVGVGQSQVNVSPANPRDQGTPGGDRPQSGGAVAGASSPTVPSAPDEDTSAATVVQNETVWVWVRAR